MVNTTEEKKSIGRMTSSDIKKAEEVYKFYNDKCLRFNGKRNNHRDAKTKRFAVF
jgi:hypothetical protein